jgi:hypothetical protein
MNAPTSRFILVLLAGGVAVLATACSAVGRGTATAPAGASSGPVPVTSAGHASPTASPAPGGGACTAAHLALRPLGGGLVSGGADVYYIYFTNTGKTACTLRGYPAVAAVTGPDGSASQIGPAATQSAASPATPQLLQPGHTTQATLRFVKTGAFTSSQCHRVPVLFLKIVPPGTTTARYAGIDEQACAGATLPTMTITTVAPGR